MKIDKQIFEKLRKCLDEMKGLFEDDNIFCIYVYGKANYEDKVDMSDVKTEVIYIPTFEELCFDFPTVKVEKFENEEIIVRDIRNIFTLDYDNNNLHCAEMLFTDYFIVNPKYELIFKNIFREYREEVLESTRKIRLVYGARAGINYLNKHKIEQAKAVYDFCDKLKSRVKFAEFFNLNDVDKTEEELRLYFENILFISAKFECNNECCEIKNAVMDIIKSVICKDNSGIQKFIDELTLGEFNALKFIITNSQKDGLINVSRMSEETGISRQLFSTLFSKLKTSNYATVKNMGMKGTYIKFLNNSLINKIIEKY